MSSEPQDNQPTGSPGAKKSGNAKATRPLPTGRIAFPKQLELLRAYAIAGADGAVVQNRKLAEMVGMNYKTTSLANAFFLDIGFIRRDEGGVLPAAELIAFQQSFQWDPERATWELAPIIKESWFAKALLAQLRLRPLSEKDAISTMAKVVTAGPNLTQELRMLLDYLEAANLILRDGGMVQGGQDITPPDFRPPSEAEPSARSDAESPAPPRAVPSDASVQRGALPLLIQGLLEQLPKDGRWTAAKKKTWLDMADMTFDLVYEIPGFPEQQEEES